METNEIIEGLIGPIKLGSKIFVATVTYHYIGKVQSINDKIIVLTDCEISADLGNYEDFLKTQKPKQSEKIGKCLIYQHAIVSIIELTK